MSIALYWICVRLSMFTSKFFLTTKLFVFVTISNKFYVSAQTWIETILFVRVYKLLHFEKIFIFYVWQSICDFKIEYWMKKVDLLSSISRVNFLKLTMQLRRSFKTTMTKKNFMTSRIHWKQFTIEFNQNVVYWSRNSFFKRRVFETTSYFRYN